MEQLGFDRNGAIYRSIDHAYTAFLELTAELFGQAHGFTAAKPPPEPREVTRAKDQLKDQPTIRILDRDSPSSGSVAGWKRVSFDPVQIVTAGFCAP
jgi:hypothetical protein